MVAGVLAVSALAAANAPTQPANLLTNGSFERAGAMRNAAALREKGFDVAPEGRPVPWPDGWTVNPAVGCGRVRIVAGAGASGGGERYLNAQSPTAMHLYTAGGKAGRRYHWRLTARGEPMVADGKRVPAQLTVAIYLYGQDEFGGPLKFIGSRPFKRITLGGKWQRYQGTLRATHPKAKEFGLFLAISGNVSVDEVRLWSAPTPVNPAAPASEPLKRVFYLPLDGEVDAAEAGGRATATVVGQLTFAKGKVGQAGVFAGGAHLGFDAAKNFDQNEGTLAMWVKPFWDNDDGKAHCFVEAPVPPHAFIDSGFVLTKGFTNRIAPNLTYFLNGPPWHAVSPHVKSWQVQRWLHVTLAWSQRAGILRLYVNGERVGEAVKPFAQRPGGRGRRLVVGARLGGRPPAAPTDWPVTMGNLKRDYPPEGACPADALIDELAIYGRLVTHQEAWRLAGRAGPVPEPKSKPLTPEAIVTLPHDLQTPHVPFAKPLAGGPVKALFLVPLLLARDVVELWQRLDLDYDAFILSSRYSGGPLKYSKHGQRYFRDLSDKARVAALMKKLDRRPPVIVLVAMVLKRTPRSVVARIMTLVRAGTGLVIVSRAGRPDLFLEKADPTGRPTITAGVPWSGLTELFAGEQIPVAEWPSRAVSTYRCGKGRVVRVRYRTTPAKPPGWMYVEDGLTPGLYERTYTRDWDSRYGRYLSIVAKAVRWAAGREKPWRVTLPADGARFARKDLPGADALRIEVAPASPGKAVLSVAIRDRLGDAKLQREFPAPGKLAVTVPKLAAGVYYLDVQVRVDGKVADWGSVAFRVDSPDVIKAVRLHQASVERGQELAGSVAFANPLAEPASLVVRAIDTNGRVYAERRQTVEVDTQTTPFRIQLDDPTTIASYVEARLVRGAEVVTTGETVVFVPKRNLGSAQANQFPSI